MKPFSIWGGVLTGILCTQLAVAKDAAPPPDIFETLDVRPLTRSNTDVYDVLTQLIGARADYAANRFGRSYLAYKYVALHDRNNIEAALGTANSALQINRAGEAVIIFENLESAELTPAQSLAVQTGLVLAEYQLGEIDDPELRINQVLALTQTDPRLWTTLGDIYSGKTQWQKAAQSYQRAHKEGGSKARLYNNFGKLLMAQKNYGGAIRYFELASKLEPEAEVLRMNHRMSLLMDGQYASALNRLTDTGAAKLLSKGGQLAMQHNEPDFAKLLLMKSVEISPVYNAEAQASLEGLGHIDN